MITKEKANLIAKIWNNGYFTDATKTTARVQKAHTKGYDVIIEPAGENDGHGFYDHEMLSDICRLHRASACISLSTNKEGKYYIAAMIF